MNIYLIFLKLLVLVVFEFFLKAQQIFSFKGDFRTLLNVSIYLISFYVWHFLLKCLIFFFSNTIVQLKDSLSDYLILTNLKSNL